MRQCDHGASAHYRSAARFACEEIWRTSITVPTGDLLNHVRCQPPRRKRNRRDAKDKHGVPANVASNEPQFPPSSQREPDKKHDNYETNMWKQASNPISH